jgi:hypothetical protein
MTMRRHTRTNTTRKGINAVSAETMTRIVKREFGADFFATAGPGRRQIKRSLATGGVDGITAETWSDALMKARDKFTAQTTYCSGCGVQDPQMKRDALAYTVCCDRTTLDEVEYRNEVARRGGRN